LNGGAITNGGNLTTTRLGSTGSITIQNVGNISVNQISTDVQATDTAYTSGFIAITNSGSVRAYSTSTHAAREGTTGSQSFVGDDTGAFTLLSSGMAIDSRHTGTMYSSAGSVTILDYTAVSISGDIATTVSPGSGGSGTVGGAVKIGDSGNPIGGSITVGKITTQMSGGYNGGNVSLYADGAITVGDIVTGASTPTSYGTPAVKAGDVTVVGKSFTAGAIQGWARREGGNPPGKISLTGTDGSGACTVSSLSTERSCYAGTYYAATITISNFSAITVNGDVRADIVTSDGSANGGAITMSSGAGGIDIKGALSAKAYSTGTKGPMSLTCSGREITLSSLNLSNVQYAVVSPGWKCIVKGDLLGFSTNETTQTQLRMPVGKRMIYYPDLTNNAYLAGGKYALASPGGTPAAGGVLMPYASPGTVVMLK
jgi:hypothetical protein